MQAILNIQDSLWQQALRLANTTSQEELIILALTEFVKNHSQSDTEQALLESRLDLKQGNFSKDDIDAHVAEMFDL